jgi:hypothetical protein
MKFYYVCENYSGYLRRPEVPKLWGTPPGGAVGPWGAGSSNCLYEGHVYFERNMGPR